MTIEGDIWCIAYINKNFIGIISKELKQYDYDMVEMYVPTIKVLKKVFKNTPEFEEVPLLFNYGFFKIPYKYACNEDWLSLLRQRITAIYGWVKDGSRPVAENPGLTEEGDRIDYIPRLHTAVATDKELSLMVKSASKLNIFSQEDIDNLEKGSYITLKGYPFDDLPAEVISINKRTKDIKVKLLLDTAIKEVTVSFENVFYTIYSSFDQNMREKIESEMNLKSNSTMEDIMKRDVTYG